MDTSQYLTMFLEESMDNLQTLNESLLELEKNPDDNDRINQIFRVAHTIKGMAATMGFNDMAELTHKMEDVLSEFREGELKVTQEVVTVLFDCLDTLEKMVDNIEDENDEVVDIQGIIEKLEKVAAMGKSGEQIEESKPEDKDETTEEKSTEGIQLNEYDCSVIKQAQEKGFNAVRIDIKISESTLLKSARAFLIVKDLEDQGEIIKSDPPTEQIENEEFDTTLQFVLVTNSTAEDIKKLVEGISEVEEVNTKLLDIDEEEKNIKNTKKEEVKPKEIETRKEQKPKEIETRKEQKPKVKTQEKQSVKKKSVKKAHQSVRVDLERIDKLMNMVSEIVIYRTRLEQIVIDNKSPELSETLEQIGRTTSDLQDLVMKIRMLPLETVFNRFPRMIRDISVELNKEINFVIEGAETELDRTVIDEIGEPLIHLLRNAADHGIESKEEREKAGKNPVGTIKLIAYQEGTKALIKVVDDGAGINVEKVKEKA